MDLLSTSGVTEHEGKKKKKKKTGVDKTRTQYSEFALWTATSFIKYVQIRREILKHDDKSKQKQYEIR